MNSEEARIKEEQYSFPYHHIPHFAENDTPQISRRMRWGFEYLCCKQHIVEEIVGRAPNSIIDIGCGDGSLLGELSRKVPKCVGVDFRSAQ